MKEKQKIQGDDIKFGSIEINITNSPDTASAVSLQLIRVVQGHCRVLYIIPVCN